MADRVNYGGSEGDWRGELERANAQSRNIDEMAQKEERRRAVEEKSQTTSRDSASVRSRMAQQTETLTGRLTANTTALEAETAALQANIAVMERAVNLRRAMAGLPIIAGEAGVAGAVGGGAAGASGARAAGASDAELRAETNRLAQERATLNAERVRAAEATVAGAGAGRFGQRLLPPARSIQVGPAGTYGVYEGASGEPLPEGARYQAPPPPRPAPPIIQPTQWRPSTEQAQFSDQVESNRRAVAALGGEQARTNQVMAEAGALYADNSSRLTRHGALTTEFLQSLARGQVTLREFGEQLTSVAGKFGGWLVAGAAIYGVYDLFKHLTQGATETQAAIQNLGRFIPGLGGPAGGGTFQIPAAESAVRNLSTQFNLPISEVADPLQVMARLYGSGPNPLRNSVQATQAVLAAKRLDQVPTELAEQYLTGIAQVLPAAPGQRLAGGQSLVGVINVLNAFQSQLGARVNQTLPALARAAPAALAGGLPIQDLESLTALGVRAGIPGAQVGTALLRSIGTFAWRPSSQLSFREYGIEPTPGDYGGLLRQVIGTIDRRAVGTGESGPRGTGPLSGPDLRNLAVALGGNLLGARTLLPILAAEQEHPGLYDRALGVARAPRPYQEDLSAVLGSVSERFKAIGITLQNFGSQLAQAGLLTPITAVLNVFNLLAHAVEAVVSPFAQMLGVVNEIPGPLRDMLGLFVAFRASRFLLNTQFGGGAQSFFGRLPGLNSLLNEPREAVEGVRGNLQREILPLRQRTAEDATRRYDESLVRLQNAQNDLAAFTARGAPAPGTEEFERYQEGITTRRQAIGKPGENGLSGTGLVGNVEGARGEAVSALAQANRTQALINLSKNDEYTWSERAAILAQEGFIASSQTLDLTRAYNDSYAQRIAAMRESGGAQSALGRFGSQEERASGRGAVDEAAVIAGATAAVGPVASALGRNGSAMTDLLTGAAAATPRVAAAGQTEATSRLERLTGATGLGVVDRTAQIQDRLSGLFSGAGYALQPSALRERLGASPGATPFAALLGTQLLGGAVGGGLGSYITNVGGQAATGALIAQMLGRGGWAGVLAGGTLGSVAGNFQQGGNNGLLSLLGAGGGGGIAALGAAIAGGPIGIAAGIGALAGSTILPAIFGSSQSPQDAQNAGVRAAALRRGLPRGLADLLSSGGSVSHGFYNYGNDEGQLLTAFLGSGSTSQSAQANIRSRISALTAETQLFGTRGPQGRAAQAGLTQLIEAAISTSQYTPEASAQLVQEATQAKSKPIQDVFTARLAQTDPRLLIAPTGGRNLLDSAAAATSPAAQAAQQYQQEVVGPFYRVYLEAQANLKSADDSLQQAIKSGSQQRIRAARAGLATAQQQAQGAQAAYSYSQDAATQAEQANYLQQYQVASQFIQARGTLEQAQAGGSQIGQLRAQLRSSQSQISTLQHSGVRGSQYTNTLEQLKGQQAQVQNQIAQQPLTEIQAQGQLLVSQAPLGDPVAQARDQYQAYLTQLNYMQAHSHAFDPSQIIAMQAQVNDALKNIAQTASDYALQMTQIQTQIAQAENYGNVIAQAAAGITGARNQTREAVTPLQQRQARLAVATANQQAQQAQLQRISEQGQLAEAQASGDPIAAAQAARTLAQRTLAASHGVDQQLAAETALAQANFQLQQALVERQTALGQLSASETVNPVEALRRQMVGLGRALPLATTPQLRIQTQTQFNQVTHQYEQGLIDQRASIVDFQFQMQQITSGQAVKQLEDLTHLKGITLAQRQQLLEQARRYRLGLESPIGAQGFDLAPGNIRLPTYYDVGHAITGGRAPHTINTHAPTQINVYVKRAEDTHRVADVLDRTVAAGLRRRLGAAGVGR